MASQDPETVLLKTPDQTKVIFQHLPHPPMTGIVLRNANSSLTFDLKGVSGQEHRPYPIGLWHLVNVYRKLHGIKESLDPLKCLLVDVSNSSACSNLTLLHTNSTMESSLKQQAKLELVPTIPEALRQAERQALKHLTEGEVEEVHFRNFEFPYLIRLVSDGTFTLSGRQITEHIHLHSLELLYFMKRHRIVQDDYSLPPISPLVIPNQMYALDRLFFKDSAWDQTRSLGHHLSDLATELVEPDLVVPVAASVLEKAQLSNIVTKSTPIRVPESKGTIRAWLLPDGTFDIETSDTNSCRLNSWSVLHAFKKDALLNGTPDNSIKDLQPLVASDPFYAMKHIYLSDNHTGCSLYEIYEEIYRDMPPLIEIVDSPGSILERMKHKEAVLRAEIQVYKNIQQQININRQLEAELQQLKVAVGSV